MIITGKWLASKLNSFDPGFVEWEDMSSHRKRVFDALARAVRSETRPTFNGFKEYQELLYELYTSDMSGHFDMSLLLDKTGLTSAHFSTLDQFEAQYLVAEYEARDALGKLVPGIHNTANGFILLVNFNEGKYAFEFEYLG